MSEMDSGVLECDVALRFGLGRAWLKKFRAGSLREGEHWFSDGKRVLYRPAGLALLLEALGEGQGEGEEPGKEVEAIVGDPGVSERVQEEMDLCREVERERRLEYEVKVIRVWPERDRQVLGLFEGRKVRVDVQDASGVHVGMVLKCERRHESVFACRRRIGGGVYKPFHRSMPR